MFEHLSDFNLSVPYSLNRKNRWSLVENVEEHAQLLGVKRNDGALPMDGAMFVALAESEFTHNDVNPGERLNVFFYTFNFIYNLFYYNLYQYVKIPRMPHIPMLLGKVCMAENAKMNKNCFPGKQLQKYVVVFIIGTRHSCIKIKDM